MQPPIKGRGALSNEASRFLKQTADRSADYVDAVPEEDPPRHPATRLHVDASRSIISRNDSPDVPFGQSINPYRGCEHGCVYCLAGDTPILMADGTTRPIADLRVGDLICGTVRDGQHRRTVRTTVRAHWSVLKPAYRVTLADGTQLVAGADHRFLTERGWKFVTGAGQGPGRRPHLTRRNRLIGTGAFSRRPPADGDYRRGYLSGLIRGAGGPGDRYDERPGGALARHVRLRLERCDAEAAHRARRWLSEEAVGTRRVASPIALSGRSGSSAVRAPVLDAAASIGDLIAWPAAPPPSWQRGFLAGMFDAAGCVRGGTLRICSADAQLVRRVAEALDAQGFRALIEPRGPGPARALHAVRVLGGLAAHLRFLHTADPAVTRRRDLIGRRIASAARLAVTAIERLAGARRLYDITTGTGDFIADGVVSHNCFARPTHAYLDHSPGLDFETEIYAKPDAARLLDAELRRPGYRPEPIHLGAATDPYQPLEREARLTRALLEKLLEFGHPVTVLTKGTLIERDLDVLGELARRRLARVALSITTLDRELKRSLEPRAAAPA
ncbi:MAG: radical SAM protein, partial [Proteobacteria bacterium]|nr:radical SAM protein [Pseudomonadota bacterium]